MMQNCSIRVSLRHGAKFIVSDKSSDFLVKFAVDDLEPNENERQIVSNPDAVI